MSIFQLTVLGARGSIPVSGPDMQRFGGATSCYMVKAGDQTVFLDGGSGLLDAPLDFETTPVILLSHLHLDHVLGLGMYRRLSRKDVRSDLYVPAVSDTEAQTVLDALYSPPYWPLRLQDYAGDVRLFAMQPKMQFGDLLVESMPGDHPGGCLVLKLTFEERTLVYATDQEPGDDSLERLAAFAKDADLLLYDGQFTEAEAAERKGFGHSTPGRGIELMERSGAKQLLLIHHDPARTDAMLEEAERSLGRKDVHFARAGKTILL